MTSRTDYKEGVCKRTGRDTKRVKILGETPERKRQLENI
jgi:hypothetical protein